MRKLSFSHKKRKKELFFSKLNKGFSLIELMVSTAIFMVIMLIAMGALITTSNSAKQSNGLNFTMDNLSFAIESMSRSLRMGTNYTCSNTNINLHENPAPADCLNGGDQIAFIPVDYSSDYRMSYKLVSRGDGSEKIERCDTKASPECVDMIASNININLLKFFVRGSSKSDKIQPSVYMLLKGSVLVKNKKKSFAIQTMISQRTAE